ncbi:Carboxylesterase family [Aspergillus sclerotialis]|uniref:Carboxylesterase family n=1 Tax=Aspergillus sclerotialis TaxID=2070753 RepID=A0A3A2ZX73_9EURO|nr:Carboxylesterase family [Aspergillus sclerotialis]
MFNQFLDLFNASTIEDARRLLSETLIEANAYQIGEFSYYGYFTYGPVVDGTLVPALVGQRLQ